MVLLVLMMSYASSMKAYLQQRAHIEELQAQIAQQEQRIEVLQREKQRWDDPAYVRMQARERFGYVLPGERSFVVVDGNGRAARPRGDARRPGRDRGAAHRVVGERLGVGGAGRQPAPGAVAAGRHDPRR